MSTPRAVARRTPRHRAPAAPPEGTIVGMEPTDRMSSIAYFVLKNDAGEEVRIVCDYRYTTDALISCFGEVCVIGKKIWYRVDNVGVLSEIGSVDE